MNQTGIARVGGGSGAVVSYYDPHLPVARRGRKHDLEMESVPCAGDEFGRHEPVLIAMEHSAFKDEAALYAGHTFDHRNPQRRTAPVAPSPDDPLKVSIVRA